MGARVVVGGLLIGMALFWREPRWVDAALGLMAMPALAVALLAYRARRWPGPLRATGPLGHLLNAALFLPLFLLPATAGAAFLFYGASMLVAATRRTAGCEITAIPNVLLDRCDEVGCMIFAPVDIVEARFRRIPETSWPAKR